MKVTGHTYTVLVFLLATTSMLPPPVGAASERVECMLACNLQFDKCLARCESSAMMIGLFLFLLAVASMVAPPTAAGDFYSLCMHSCNRQFDVCLKNCMSSTSMVFKIYTCKKWYFACIITCA